MASVQELKEDLKTKNALANEIVSLFSTMRTQRQEFDAEQTELRNYLFATDTSKTENSQLPWRNSTTLPKLTQIRDNLHANYMAALFPNDEWMRWQGDTPEDQEKARAIEAYLRNKLRQVNFREIASRFVYDYIDTGNVFGDVEWVQEQKTLTRGGIEEVIQGYTGPRARRYSIFDLYINPLAPDFDRAPKIIRTLVSVGELKLLAEHNPSSKYISDAIDTAMEHRKNLLGKYSMEDFQKAQAYSVDGFGNLFEYLRSPLVELIELRGDIHIDGELKKDHVITVMDRSFVIRDEPQETWLPHTSMAHVGWRLRPDNLYAQGPLHNLVGMQYRIDHLENLKADVFDLIAFPPLKIRGEVEEFEWAPFSEIHLDSEDSDVEMLTPDTAALQADLQIQLLEEKMEVYAGAPREAMGIRSPGEKTAFEVDQLTSAAQRIFSEKVLNFEINFLEPLLNSMLEVARRNMSNVETIRVFDDDLSVERFITITKEDITANGKIRPIGARHFAAQRQLIQNVIGLWNSPVAQILAPHTSAKALRKMVEDAFGLERYQLFRDNVGIFEQMETQQILQGAQQQLGEQQLVDPEEPDAEEG